MEKINFENLPSTNTPLDADTLNEMQENIEKSVVAVGPTEPSTNEKVWLKKGRNLYNPKSAYITGTNSQDISYIYKDIEVGKPYTFSATDYTWVQIKTYNSSNQLVRHTDIAENIKTATITIESGEVYIETIFNGGIDWRTSIENVDFSSVQLEQNLTATTHENYVEKEILIKNNNGVFEKFYNEEEINQENYSLGEQKIGTWIDGKPLYRKVIKLNTINRGSDNTSYNISTPNLKEVIDIRGSVTTDFGAVKPLNHFYIQNGTIEPIYSCSLYSFDSSSLQLVYGSFIAERFSFANVIVEYTKN